jgi:hypothetical protein
VVSNQYSRKGQQIRQLRSCYARVTNEFEAALAVAAQRPSREIKQILRRLFSLKQQIKAQLVELKAAIEPCPRTESEPVFEPRTPCDFTVPKSTGPPTVVGKRATPDGLPGTWGDRR